MKETERNDGGQGTTNRAARRRSMRMKTAVAGVAAASAMGLGAGLVAPPAPAQAASRSILNGIAIDPQGVITSVFGDEVWNEGIPPLIPAIKTLVGDTNSIAILPISIAASVATSGQSASAFSLIGVALGTTDISSTGLGLSSISERALARTLEAFGLPRAVADQLAAGLNRGFDIAGQVGCLGGLTVAHSSTAGACANVAGIFLGDYNPKDKSISGALVNPLAALAVLRDPTASIGGLVSGLFGGDNRAVQKLLTQDFARLGFSWGGREGVKIGSVQLPSVVSLTSDYGLIKPVSIKWLGQEATIFPAISSSATNVATPSSPNYLGFPVIKTGPFSVDQFIPDVSGLGFNNMRFPGENLPTLVQVIRQLVNGDNPLDDLLDRSTTPVGSGVDSAIAASSAKAAASTTTPTITTPTRPSVPKWTPPVRVADKLQTWQDTNQQWQQRRDTWKAKQQDARNSWQEQAQQRREQRQERRSTWQQNGGVNSWSTPGGQTQEQGAKWYQAPKLPTLPKVGGARTFGPLAGKANNGQN